MSNKVAVFVGQGAQFAGMQDALPLQSARAKESLDIASQARGYDVYHVMAGDEVNRTIYSQPAILTFSYIMFREYMASVNGDWSYFAGHSLGEYTALTCSGAITLADAVRLVALRGVAMQGAVPASDGRMAAVLGLNPTIIAAMCAGRTRADLVVEIANVNTREQVVISGHAPAVDQLCEELERLGARVIPLALSVPAHSSLMEPAAETLRRALADIEIRPPSAPLITGLQNAPLSNSDALRDHLVAQLTATFRWDVCLQRIADLGCKELVEFAPRRTLCQMADIELGSQVRASCIASFGDIALGATGPSATGDLTAASILDRMLLDAVCVPCVKYTASSYLEYVIKPYRQLEELRDKLGGESEQDGETICREAADLLRIILNEKRGLPH